MVPPKSESGEEVYGFAPDPITPVSSAASCTTTLTPDKRRAIESYFTVLGPALRGRYGRKAHYSAEQVRAMSLDRGLAIDYYCWAMVLYCARDEFAALHAAAGEACDYAAMRATVGAAFFGGNSDFSTLAVIDTLMSGAAGAIQHGGGWLSGLNWAALLD